MKKICNAFLALILLFSTCVCFTSCNKKDPKPELLAENIVDDVYDNYYEIFVYSFCDSDGNGIGDLKGVTSKLQYVRDMGYTGIWLMPIHESPSYHKYDVKDYYSVDDIYGTLDDFDELVQTAHSLGIKIILDLVVNHTSSSHPWFIQSYRAETNSNYADNGYKGYYNFVTESKAGYTKYGDVYYESRFTSDMPDLNLDNPQVRTEISKVMEFWLDRGADGFRLDACTSYYTEDGAKSVDFVRWIKEEAVRHKEGAYIVGEVWSSNSVISNFYESGADSFFCFPASQSAGYLNQTFLASKPANSYYNALTQMDSLAEGYVSAPFLGNHDTGRIAGVVGRKPEKVKFIYGIMSMLSGNTFTYYGDEIGMIGSYNDPDKRIGMLWDNAKTGLTNPPPGVTSTAYHFDGVKEQMEDEWSILNYYKRCNNARNAFPSLMRGSTQRIAYEDDYVLIMQKQYQEEIITVVINFATEEKTVTVEGELQQEICAVEGRIKQTSSGLKMPAYSIAILK